jgi:hypothetical protein
VTGSQDPLRKSAATQTDQQLPTSLAGRGCDARARLDADEHLNGEVWSGWNVTSDLTESVKPRELSAAEREAQIVALWRGRPPARRGPEQVAEFCQWLSDYTPWLLPPGEQPLDRVTAIVRPHVNGG